MSKPDFNRYNYIECWLPTQKEAFIKRGYRILEKDDLSVLKNLPQPNLNYFNSTQSKHKTMCLYDVLYKPSCDYDQKSSRCDRQSERIAKKSLYTEEHQRIIPVLSNSVYGKRKTDLQGTQLVYCRRYNKCKEFMCRRNINLKPEEGLPVKNDTTI